MKRILLAPLLVGATATTSYATCTHHTIMFPKLLVCLTCCGSGNCTTTCV
jgi:hypothetical protein